MKTEERVMTYLTESNPIPDPDSIDLAETGGAAYLATLEQRSSAVTQLDTRETKEEKSGTKAAWLVAAAVVVAGVAVILLNQGSGGPSVATQPTTQTTLATTPTTVAPPPTAVEVADPWESISTSLLGVAGEYRSNGFFVPFSYTVPEDWWLKPDQAADFFGIGADTVEVQQLTDGIFLWDLGAGTVDGTISQLIGSDRLEATDPVPTSIGGASGVSLDMTTDDPLGVRLTGTFGIVDGEAITAHVVDVGGSVVTIFVIEFTDGLGEELQAVLDSIVWKDLSD